jgi:hypothetical protein
MAFETDMETRILTITTDQRTPLGALGSFNNFDVQLQGASSDLKSSIIGVNVESVAFMNLLPNVRSINGRNVFSMKRNGQNNLIEIPGDKFYTLNTLAAELQTSIDSQLFGGPGQVLVSVTTDPSGDGGDRLTFEVLVQVILEIFTADDNLTYTMGVREDVVLSDGSGLPYPQHIFRTNLQGESAVQLVSNLLVGSRTGVNAFGAASAVLVTIPITEPYGSLQTIHIPTTRPTLVYGPQSPHDINSMDISIRYLDGYVAELENTKIHATMRLWLYSK